MLGSFITMFLGPPIVYGRIVVLKLVKVKVSNSRQRISFKITATNNFKSLFILTLSSTNNYRHTHTYTHPHIHIPTHTHTLTHTFIHLHTHIYTLTHTHTHIHIYSDIISRLETSFSQTIHSLAPLKHKTLIFRKHRSWFRTGLSKEKRLLRIQEKRWRRTTTLSYPIPYVPFHRLLFSKLNLKHSHFLLTNYIHILHARKLSSI